MPAAYTLVDLSDVEPDVRKKLIEDANAGGGTYGLRVVEEVINGSARVPIYGYYRDGPDEELWSSAKKDLGLSADDVDDDDVVPAQLEPDAAKEAALREEAARQATDLAERIRAKDDAAVEEIVGAIDETVLNPEADSSAKEAEKLAKNKAPK